ncbi:MAG TPA: putative DNA modification/repair radical SAM protein [Phycisphaerales bacterium]|nr:putative DNA modification/repair radical SAM protein [Phycisphaerales bacterium]
MDLRQKLAILADAAKYDASCASSGSTRSNRGQGLGDTDGIGICHSYTPDGRCVSLLKVLLTNYCVFDCRFCINRVTSDVARARFNVEEVVWLTMEFYKRNYIEGLLLSSGIIQSPDYTMEQLAEVARRLREQEKFFGYIHLKAVPGADAAIIDRAGRYADRLSANVELPTDEDLKRFAPEKSLRTVELTMSAIRDRHQAAKDEHRSGKSGGAESPRFTPAGQSTQLIVGASPSPDAVLLSRASTLYREQGLRRVYYSAFSPIPHADSSLPAVTPPLIREHRLYQADWLMRHYGFKAEELTTPDQPDLPLNMDPKLAWALRHRDFFPIDINRAGKAAVLRVPGIGARNARRIIEARQHRALRLGDLKRLKVALNRALPFIVAADHHPDTKLLDSPKLSAAVAPKDHQLSLFAAGVSARTGQL